MAVFRERREERHGRVVGGVDQEVPVNGLSASRRHPRGNIRETVFDDEREGAPPAGRAARLRAFQGERLSFEVERRDESREEVRPEDTVELVPEGDLARIEVGEGEGRHCDCEAGKLDREAALRRTVGEFKSLCLPAPEARRRGGVEEKPEGGTVDSGADEGGTAALRVDGDRGRARRGGENENGQDKNTRL